MTSSHKKEDDWVSIAMRSRGRSHERSGTPCQDFTACRHHSYGTVAALADGAGSASHSHEGAKLLTVLLTEWLSDPVFFELLYSFSSPLLNEILLHLLRSRLHQHAEKLGVPLKSLASTILVTAVYSGRYIALHIGDGVIGIMENNQLRAISEPQNGEFANTTVFVTSSVAAFRVYKGSTTNIQGFCLMSDGPMAGLYDKKRAELLPLLGLLIRILSVAQTDWLQNQLQLDFDENLRSLTTDDCSMVLLSPRGDFDTLSALSEEENKILFDSDDSAHSIITVEKLPDLLQNPGLASKSIRTLLKARLRHDFIPSQWA